MNDECLVANYFDPDCPECAFYANAHRRIAALESALRRVAESRCDCAQFDPCCGGEDKVAIARAALESK